MCYVLLMLDIMRKYAYPSTCNEVSVTLKASPVDHANTITEQIKEGYVLSKECYFPKLIVM